MQRRSFIKAGSAAAGTTLAPITQWACAATSVVAQAGANPVVIDQAATTDNITVLMAAAASRTSTTVVKTSDAKKNWWVTNFLNSDDFFAWNVSAPVGKAYRVYALVAAQPSQGLKLTVSQGGTVQSTIQATTANSTPSYSNFQKIDMGTVTLPSGTSTLTLTRTTFGTDLYVKSIELIESTAVAAYQSRVAAARADTTWFSKAGYGLMFQYGAWGFPNSVAPAKSLEQVAAEFNVDAFVTMVRNSGATYVIWSFSWWGYHVQAPIASVNRIVTAAGGPANPGLVSTTDLIGRVAQALQSAGIRFMMYYHPGHEDAAWWNYQNFPSWVFPRTGTGDRSTFFANWRTVLEEIGNRYGTLLDGWFFDDGMVYYPAPFEALQKSARAGNPNRLVSFNNWQLPRLTEFQDVWFGENNVGNATVGSAPAGGNGIVTSGAYTGLLEHGMIALDDDWGVHTQGGNKIGAGSATSNNLINWTRNAMSRGVPLSFNLMMYEDGSVADRDLAMVNDLRQAIRGTVEPVPTGTTLVNDTDTAIAYAGTWSYASGRGSAGDYAGDVHLTSAKGSSFSYTFTGTGIDVLGPKSKVSGDFDVAVDGAFIGTFSQYAANGYLAQAVLYSARHLAPGQHTIKLTMRSGQYFQVDALRVIPNPTTVNDSSTAVAYSGGWNYYPNRTSGDYGADVHWTEVNGAHATVTFTGTGIDVLGPMEPTDGTGDITLDGKAVGTILATFNGSYSTQQRYWSIRGLAAGTHTLKITKTGGRYLQLDAFVVWP